MDSEAMIAKRGDESSKARSVRRTIIEMTARTENLHGAHLAAALYVGNKRRGQLSFYEEIRRECSLHRSKEMEIYARIPEAFRL